ncbi:MAG TPA: acyclic terpene utilization AtuA family protein, partial [Acidimicrobiales bacterium]|nr:acyclic terpene utilization AtuA family protein [Acidimicrobiales bacterium]
IANCSGFYGDRHAAAREMVEGGPIDFLTGDYLAELTMLILWKNRLREGGVSYAKGFLRQLEEVLGTCVDRGIKVVTNAGGLDPAGMAGAVRELATRLGLGLSVAHVEGDDLMPLLESLQGEGEQLRHLDSGVAFAQTGRQAITANAYLGAFGIVECLSAGADIVVCPRVTDASLVVGPAAWRFGWTRSDLDQLAGAVVAGHILECGTQATGGNYSFFQEVPGLEHPGFPLAEIRADGSSVITKHPGTGGLVSVGTVTAQLLYEIGGPGYLNPDVEARFDTIELKQDGPDRVEVSHVKGFPPPPTTKVAINALGGFRNSVTFVLCGLDIEEKAALAESALEAAIGGRDAVESFSSRLIRTDKEDAATNAEACAELVITVKDQDQKKVGRSFTGAAIELALANYPGLFATSPPSDATGFGICWPTLVPNEVIHHEAVLPDGTRMTIPSRSGGLANLHSFTVETVSDAATTETRREPLGTFYGARSGDKAGNANVGVWARERSHYSWLRDCLTVEKMRELLPEAADLPIERYELWNLRAINFVIVGLLEEGVAASTRPDPQAKSLGEYLRSRLIDVPSEWLAHPQ